MSIISSAKGLIITGGLGGPACCSLLTANFGLVCGCVIEVVTPGSGGYAQYPVTDIPGVPQGSPYYSPAQQVPPYYTPAPRNYGARQRIVNVTIKLGQKEWKTSYIVDEVVANIIVSITKLFNASKERLRVIVSGFKRVSVSMAKIKGIGVVISGLKPIDATISGLKRALHKVSVLFNDDDK